MDNQNQYNQFDSNYNYQQPNNGYNSQQPYNGYNYQQPGGAPIKPRSIVMYIVLSIVTCGLFSLYWLVVLADDMNTVSQDSDTTSGGLVLLLSIVTCSIYLLIWSYKQGERIDRRKGSSNTGIIYLLLTLLGLNIVTMAMMQNELNSMC